ncbi:TIGR03943 family putative permease subunit [Clostridium magnum]|uniref:Putative two-component membrane permease complex subunit n=1 Tax=Clostridium magnum DSM 2767 TaxID=1121326 RepID=A0A161XB01_9CLOT|nr:TIGR03943 family protein [Clostridium magnum]KZL91436.1 putative two-component membrane permease complex subunit [Clostridium magnum DSM 2767]SHH42251.1 putative membrane protein [Clostridium magnum DSM 2767]
MKLNKSEFKWFLILIGFTCYVFNLLSTGKIYLFLNPRMVKCVYLSFTIFLLLSIFQFRRLSLSTENSKRKISFCIFLVPLFLGVYINPQGLNSEVATKRGITVISNVSTKQPKNDTSKIQKKSSANDSLKDSTLFIDGKNFTHITDDICYNDPNKYEGRRVTIIGFIYRDDPNLKNEFLVARLMMVCCAADTEVVGLSCDWLKASILKNNEWVKITGIIKLETCNIDGEKNIKPIISVEKVEPAEQPKNQYVYPE